MILIRIVLVAALVALQACAQSPIVPWQSLPLSQAIYDNETQEFGVKADSTAIRTSNFEALTPTTISGAHVITTPELRSALASSDPPLLIDVLGGRPTMSLPGAISWPWAGGGSSLSDETQDRLEKSLTALADGNKQKAIVIFCLSKTCWLSHNTAIRAVSLGFNNVYWYRGGRNAWVSAGLPLEPLKSNNN